MIGCQESSSLRECGNPASFAGFPRAGERGKAGVRPFPRFPRRFISAANPNYARFGAKVVVACYSKTKCAFTESRIKRPLLQILVESRYFRQLDTVHFFGCYGISRANRPETTVGEMPTET